MKNMDIMYRPPYEAQSLLLLATSGCSHNACRFCTMYKNVPFEVAPLDLIEKQLIYAAEYQPHKTRAFLENGDAFTLDAAYLLEIAKLIHRYMPSIGVISMYAQIQNIMTKTDEDFRKLAAAGIGELNIGLESGVDDVLAYLRKGYTAAEAEHALMRLHDAGIPFSVNVIFGAAGAGRGTEHGEATARFLNKVQPYLIFTGTIHPAEGCDMFEDMRAGRFIEPVFEEYIAEEERFLETLAMRDAEYFGIHPANILQLHGQLPADKEKLLCKLRKERAEADPALLSKLPERIGLEGMIFNWN